VGDLDRTKHETDILEHVFRGVRASVGDDRLAAGRVTSSVSPWLGGITISDVQVSVIRDEGGED